MLFTMINGGGGDDNDKDSDNYDDGDDSGCIDDKNDGSYETIRTIILITVTIILGHIRLTDDIRILNH